MALLSIFIHSMVVGRPISFIASSLALFLGRILNYLITGDLVTSIIVALVAEDSLGLCIEAFRNRQTAESIG